MDPVTVQILQQLQQMQQMIGQLAARQDNLEQGPRIQPQPQSQPQQPPSPPNSFGSRDPNDDDTKDILSGILKWEWNLPNDRRLDEKNWLEWRAVFCAEMQGLGLNNDTDIVNLPTRYQQKIRAQVLRNLSKSTAQTVVYHTDFTSMWQVLSSYEASIEITVAEELTTLMELECKNDPLEFISKVRACHAALLALGRPVAAHEKVHFFFRAVTKRYPTFSQNLHYRITKMTDQAAAFEELIGEFKSMVGQRKISHFTESGRNGNSNNGNNGDNRKASNWRNSYKGADSTEKKTFKGKCNHCGIEGHKEADCWRLHPEKRPNRDEKKKVKKEQAAHITTSSASTQKQDFTALISFQVTNNTSAKSTIPPSISHPLVFKTAINDSWLSKQWLFDTGASVHVVNNPNWFDGKKFTEPIGHRQLITGAGPVEIIGIGTVLLKVIHPDGTDSELTLADTVYCPQFPMNIFSGLRLYQKGGYLDKENIVVPDGKGGRHIATELNVKRDAFFIKARHFDGSITLEMKDSVNLVNPFTFTSFIQPEVGRLMVNEGAIENNDDDLEPEEVEPIPTSDQKAEKARIWHRRLVHPGQWTPIATKKITTGMDELPYHQYLTPCADCDKSKSLRYTPKDRRKREAQAGLGLHIDVVVCKPATWNNAKYIITATDDFSRLKIAKTMRTKSEGGSYASGIIQHFANLTSFHPDWVTIDNGSDCNFGPFAVHCRQNGISITPSPPYSQDRNGVAERTWRTVFDRVRSIMDDMRIPQELWAEIFLATIYVLNRSSTSTVTGKTPVEAFNDDIQRPKPNKPDIANLRILGCKVFVNVPPEQRTTAQKADANVRAWEGILCGYEGQHLYRCWVPSRKTVVISGSIVFHEPGGLEPPVFRSVPRGTFRNKTKKPVPPNQKRPANADETEELAHLAVSIWQASSAGGNWFDAAEAFSTDILMAIVDPIPAKKAVKLPQEGPIWKSLIYAEIQQMIDKGVFKFVSSQGKRKISTRFVLTRNNANRQPKKARLVARGFQQLEGIDYKQTFASTSRAASWRILLALTAQKKWKMRQIDVIGAYLMAPLKEEIFIEQLDFMGDFFRDNPIQAAKVNWNPHADIQLLKALYGLKQAGHEWQQKLRAELQGMGFRNLLSDPAVYYCGEKQLVISTHVDDLLVFGENEEVLITFEAELSSKMDLKIQGEPELYLGIEITQNDSSIHLSQSFYLSEVANRFGLLEGRNMRSPMDQGTRDQKIESKGLLLDEKGKQRFQSMIGALMYAAVNTRPDLSFTVGFLARSMNKPYTSDEIAAKRAIQYAKQPLKITYGNHNAGRALVTGFCDADWAGCIQTSRSTSGYVFMIEGSPVSWSSSRQAVVARSTTEAEYYGLGAATAEASWIREFLAEINCPQAEPIHISTDNTGCISVAENDHITARTRHIRIQYHFVKQEIQDQRITVKYVKGDENAADLLTKPLGTVLHNAAIGMIGLSGLENLEG